MPLAHVSFGVRDVKKAQAFYDAALAPLGYKPVFSFNAGNLLVAVGYGETEGNAEFWIQLPYNQIVASAGNGVHVAFDCKTRAQVDAFYLAALAKGGRDDGKPGLRSEYSPDYYGAFIRDLDDNKVEAVCHTHED